jgi:hypothetical protein
MLSLGQNFNASHGNREAKLRVSRKDGCLEGAEMKR